jgi:PilZ domain
MKQDLAPPRAGQIDRKSPRRRVLKDGKIIFGQAQSVVDCTIDNVSEGGAHVRLGSSCALPQEFFLVETTRGFIYRAEAAWRTVDGIGIRLLGPVDDAKQRESFLRKFKR